MRFQSYFNTAIKIIQSYTGAIPLQHFLKQYFSEYKKHGSTDRKIITHICYNFYRLGKSFPNINIEEKLKLAIFICNDDLSNWTFLFDNYFLNSSKNLSDRVAFVKTQFPDFNLNDVFPFDNEVSETLNTSAFAQSFFIQPDVFIRIRPGYYDIVLKKLNQHTIAFNAIDENCIAVSASTKINSIINIDEEAVVQDLSSQQIKKFLEIIKPVTSNSAEAGQALRSATNVWDCCAGSGGKSILAYDIFGNINLSVSDVRASIIHNLKQRFAKAGIKNYKAFVADITKPLSNSLPLGSMEGIICDAPCTGSGTWSRTPEQLYFFQPEKIEYYSSLQKKIATNTITQLKQNGYFLYITCSVFKKENEEIVDYIKQQFHLELIKMELLKGYTVKADTMFAALFKKI